MLLEKHEQIGHELEAQQALIAPDFVDALDAARSDQIGDDPKERQLLQERAMAQTRLEKIRPRGETSD